MSEFLRGLVGIRFRARALVLMLLSSCAAIMVSFVGLSSAVKVGLFVDYAYYVVGLSVVLAVCFALRPLYKQLRGVDWGRPDIWAFAILALFFGVLFHFEENCYKVTMDEVVLMGTSKQLSEEASPTWLSYGYWFDGEYLTGNRMVDKRPILYPFLVSILHTIFGFARENAFLLNNFLSLVVVFGLYAFLRFQLRVLPSFIASFLYLGIPEFVMMGNGGGMGPLNLCVILLVLMVSVIYLKSPTVENMNALIFSGVLLSQVRPESVVYIAGVVLVLMVAAWRSKCFPVSYWASLVPWLCAFYVFQKSIYELRPMLWEELGERSILSSEYFTENFYLNLKYFFSVGYQSSNSIILTVLGLGALGVALPVFIRDRGRLGRLLARPFLQVVAIFTGVLLFLFLLFHFYYVGSVFIVNRSRYTLPLCLFLCIGIACVLSLRELRGKSVGWMVCLLAFSEMLIWTLPGVLFDLRLKYSVLENWKYDFIQAHRGERYLVIGGVEPLQWFLYEQSAVVAEVAVKWLPQLKYLQEIGYFDEVYYIHTLAWPLDKWKTASISTLEDVLTLEPYEPGRSPLGAPFIERVTHIEADLPYPLPKVPVHLDSPALHGDSELRQRVLDCLPRLKF